MRVWLWVIYLDRGYYTEAKPFYAADSERAIQRAKSIIAREGLKEWKDLRPYHGGFTPGHNGSFPGYIDLLDKPATKAGEKFPDNKQK